MITKNSVLNLIDKMIDIIGVNNMVISKNKGGFCIYETQLINASVKAELEPLLTDANWAMTYFGDSKTPNFYIGAKVASGGCSVEDARALATQ